MLVIRYDELFNVEMDEKSHRKITRIEAQIMARKWLLTFPHIYAYISFVSNF